MDVIPCTMQRIPALPTIRSQPLVPSALVPRALVPHARRAGATLSEVFPALGAEAAAAGFVLAQLGEGSGAVLWVQDWRAQRESGWPYLAGLGLQRRLLLMPLSKPLDVLVAVEEGLRCKTLAGVVAEIRGDHPAVNFTALKRLALRAEAAGVACWLIRQAASVDLSAARNRWRIDTLPSAANPDDPHAPGDPRWRLELFRTRDGRPGTWVARHERGTNGAADRLDLVAAVPDGALAEAARASG